MKMNRRAFPAALAVLCTLAACVVNLSFDMQKSIPVATVGTGTSLSQTQLVNLSDYKEIQEHKDSIKSLTLDSADVTVQTVNPANRARVVNGTMLVRKTLNDPAETPIPVGALTNFSLTQNSSVRLPGSPALDAFLFQQLQSGGTFYVVVQGAIDQAPADVVLSVTMHSNIAYGTGF